MSLRWRSIERDGGSTSSISSLTQSASFAYSSCESNSYEHPLSHSFPETKGRNLEEIDDIFNAKNPVKQSLKQRQVNVVESETGAVHVKHR